MDYLKIANELERNTKTFKSLLAGKEKENFTWTANPQKWSLLDIVCHLYDEECLDFRARVKHVLFHSEEPMPSIDPEGWVVKHHYAAQDYEQMLQQFIKEREASVLWLRNLEQPNWNKTYLHPVFGEVTAKMFLENWLAHDYLHIRQIMKLNYDYLLHCSKGDFRYAGAW